MERKSYLLTIEDISEDGVIANSRLKPTTPEREQVERCKRWIQEHAVPYKGENSWNFMLSSYNLKGAVERWTRKNLPSPPPPDARDYVTNGAFIVAALELGYKARPRREIQDAYFNMKLLFRKGDPEWFAAGFIHT